MIDENDDSRVQNQPIIFAKNIYVASEILKCSIVEIIAAEQTDGKIYIKNVFTYNSKNEYDNKIAAHFVFLEEYEVQKFKGDFMIANTFKQKDKEVKTLDLF